LGALVAVADLKLTGEELAKLTVASD